MEATKAKMKAIHLAKNLSLPLEAVTQAIGILAKRRAGKSYAARRLAEQLFNAGQQIVIVDPKGDWWGIRSSADGKSPGLPVVILGGERGDVPLEVNAGEVVAKLVVEERVSVLLDLSLLRKKEVATFMTMFLETLYRLKAREQYRTPVMLIVDEADAIAPQKPFAGEERMLGAAEDIVRRGGQRGIGCTLITQRSAVLNKNVLTQIQILIVLRTIAPQDLKAIDAWIDVHGTEEERKVLKESLPSLPTGDGWVWSPGWPNTDGIFEHVHISAIETFDSGATPKPGEKRVEPKNLADVDLDALSRQMADTIEKAKAENPKELQKKVRDLEARLKKAESAKPAAAPGTTKTETKTIEKRMVIEGTVTRLEKLLADASKLEERLRDTSTAYTAISSELAGILFDARKINEPFQAPRPLETAARDLAAGRPDSLGPRRVQQPPPRKVAQQAKRELPAVDGEMTGPQIATLEAVVKLELTGVANPSLVQVAVVRGVSHTTGTFKDDVRKIIARGYLERRPGGAVSATEEGFAAVEYVEPIHTLSEYWRFWDEHLPAPRAAILREIVGAYPEAISRDMLASTLNKSPTTGTFKDDVRKLRNLGLVSYEPDSAVRATELMFLPGLS